MDFELNWGREIPNPVLLKEVYSMLEIMHFPQLIAYSLWGSTVDIFKSSVHGTGVTTLSAHSELSHEYIILVREIEVDEFS